MAKARLQAIPSIRKGPPCQGGLPTGDREQQKRSSIHCKTGAQQQARCRETLHSTRLGQAIPE